VRLAQLALGRGMTFTEVAATLVYEPYNVPLRDILDMDPRQVRRVYFAPRDEKGHLIRNAPLDVNMEVKQVDQKDYFFRTWRARGFSDNELRTMWEQRQRGAR